MGHRRFSKKDSILLKTTRISEDIRILKFSMRLLLMMLIVSHLGNGNKITEEPSIERDMSSRAEEISKDEFKTRVKAKPKVSLEQFEDLKYSGDWVNCPDFSGCWTDYPVCIPGHDVCCQLEFPNFYPPTPNVCYALD